MDWSECLKERIAKEIMIDKNLVDSLQETAEVKIKAAEFLPDELLLAK